MPESYAVGLRDLHFAPESSEGTGYSTPKKLSSAITATITPNFTVTTLYGDDRAVAVAHALGDIDIQINTTDLTPEDYELLMGAKKNADGVIEDSVDDVAPYGALMFRLPLESGGFKYYAYYKGKFQPPGSTHNTKGGSTEFQTPSVTGKFMARKDGKWRSHFVDSDKDSQNQVAADWFKNVYEPTPEA
jgi:phi13 family phage major tail protein